MVDEVSFLGRRFVSDTTAIRGEDGIWTLTVYIKEYKTYDGENWEEKSVNATALDADLDSAYNVAVASAMNQFGDALAQGNGTSMFKDV